MTSIKIILASLLLLLSTDFLLNAQHIITGQSNIESASPWLKQVKLGVEQQIQHSKFSVLFAGGFTSRSKSLGSSVADGSIEEQCSIQIQPNFYFKQNQKGFFLGAFLKNRQQLLLSDNGRPEVQFVAAQDEIGSRIGFKHYTEKGASIKLDFALGTSDYRGISNDDIMLHQVFEYNYGLNLGLSF